MPWNGSGSFTRVYSWVADAAAGLNILASRTDTDSNDIASNGFGNVITRDGQGQPTANLPMANFRHTGVSNGVARTDYSSLQQAQDGLVGWTIAGGTSDAITAAYTPSQGAPADGQVYCFRATASNATTTPTFNPNSQGAQTITKFGGQALAIGDIPGNLAEIFLRYNSANTRYELLNPVFGEVSTGDVKVTLKTTADAGWLMFDDTTFGSGSSGAGHTSASYQALFTLLYNNTTDANCPILTSVGGATTRVAQGSASAAWAANCRMTLPKTLGRAIAVSGSGSGLTSLALGQSTGANTVTLTAGEIPTLSGIAGTAVFGSDVIAVSTAAINSVSVTTGSSGPSPSSPGGTWGGASSLTVSASYTNGSPSAVSIQSPVSAFNIMVKL